MDCLLFGGAQSVGKSESIYRLTTYLLGKGFVDILGKVPPVFKDFSAVLEGFNKNGKAVRVIINTATDTTDIIVNFRKFYDNNGSYDILISSIRDYNFWPRAEFFSIMGITHKSHQIIEVPLAKITRRGTNFTIALSWYYNHIDELSQHLIGYHPFNI
jgi:hypothetical protein